MSNVQYTKKEASFRFVHPFICSQSSLSTSAGRPQMLALPFFLATAEAGFTYLRGMLTMDRVNPLYGRLW